MRCSGFQNKRLTATTNTLITVTPMMVFTVLPLSVASAIYAPRPEAVSVCRP